MPCMTFCRMWWAMRSAIEDNLADMRVILDEWGEGYVA